MFQLIIQISAKTKSVFIVILENDKGHISKMWNNMNNQFNKFYEDIFVSLGQF